MSTLPNVAQLSSEQLAVLKVQIANLEAKRTRERSNLHAFLVETSNRMQALAQAAGMVIPALPGINPQPQATTGNGSSHKPAQKAEKTVKRAKRRQTRKPAVVTKAAKAPQPTKGKTIAIKYRDPANLANTWSGRGKMPKWMTLTGQPKEAFLISQVSA